MNLLNKIDQKLTTITDHSLAWIYSADRIVQLLKDDVFLKLHENFSLNA
jgi:hypothetical protein